ncbi:HNH endonuclease [Roseixanthobacter psychrophilus]|uniref:HNH endonuclease n=1 Tax=Roseixanthobacter psychrophilus TaxID=3119917 RepID=UPI003D24F4E0
MGWTGMDIKLIRIRLGYDPYTGHFIHLSSTGGALAGAKAGRIGALGYMILSVKGRELYAHRVAWALYYGEWPEVQVDHINRERDDNRIVNLRLATNSQNQANTVARVNSKSGIRGVVYRPDKNRWVAQITCDGRQYQIGSFQSEAEAAAAYAQRSRALFGQFSRA